LQKKYNISLDCQRAFKSVSSILKRISLSFSKGILLILFLSVVGNPLSEVKAQDALPKDEYYNGKIEQRSFNTEEWKSLTKDLDYSEDGAKKESSTHRRANTTGERGEDEEDEERRTSGKMSPFWAAVFKWTIVAIAIGIVAALLYNVLGGGSIFAPRGKKVNAENEAISIETIEANIHESDLDRHIREALEQRNFTLAIRLYYLAVIKELSLGKLIKWKRDKTNRDYLREMRKTTLFNPYRDATRIFERVFYGNATIQEQDFNILKPRFVDLLNKIKKMESSGAEG